MRERVVERDALYMLLSLA
jgi:hypothetical protein